MIFRIARFCTLAVACGLASQAVAQTNPTTRIRGTIERFDGSSLVIKAREGNTFTVKLTDNPGVAAVVKASLDDIKPGTFVGTAALPQKDGSRKALEVLIFPEAMRGAGEGDRAWDLMPESTMTNATVADSVGSVDGKAMTLTYKGGSQKITVPPDAPIVTFAPGTVAELVPGTPVFLSAEQMPDGTMRASRITVGRNGVAPPM